MTLYSRWVNIQYLLISNLVEFIYMHFKAPSNDWFIFKQCWLNSTFLILIHLLQIVVFPHDRVSISGFPALKKNVSAVALSENLGNVEIQVSTFELTIFLVFLNLGFSTTTVFPSTTTKWHQIETDIQKYTEIVYQTHVSLY